MSRHPPTTQDLVDRFFSKVEFTDGCWTWSGSKRGGGYGRFWAGDRDVSAHRWIYEFCVGPIPEGMQIDHLCCVKHCVNPDHLQVTTPRENILRSNGVSAINARKTHCPQGHEYTPENTAYRTTVLRSCRQCGRDRQKEKRSQDRK